MPASVSSSSLPVVVAVCISSFPALPEASLVEDVELFVTEIVVPGALQSSCLLKKRIYSLMLSFQLTAAN
jgi:hypothetical protein